MHPPMSSLAAVVDVSAEPTVSLHLTLLMEDVDGLRSEYLQWFLY